MDSEELTKLKDLARQVRIWSLKATTRAGSGHPGGSLSIAEILVDLYFRNLRHNPSDPAWADRDRFILSKGHGVPALYAAMGLSGYFPIENMMSLRNLGSPFQGHPDRRFISALEASTGSLGQGLSIGIGVALAARLSQSEHHTYVLLGDGECQEGQIWEAAMFAGFHKLGNLTAIVDFNKYQLDDATSHILELEPFAAKWEACNWTALRIDGHDLEAVDTAMIQAREDGKPTVIIADTVKGKGVSFVEGNNDYHGKALTPAELERALGELGGTP
ncbi:MAG TPA: transketolase [Thermoanaerobaculia bacterium]|nr:transketolase [Thermoanaerobaculia bacterium]HUM29144.1 transketolase [Thermoanaerobaculia bacterium]HXK67521.1 transketolase [Thermoanaerobaculia bacterium]